MKIRVLDRILVAVAGIILLALCTALVAQVFFQADVVRFISDQVNLNSRLFRRQMSLNRIRCIRRAPCLRL